MEVPRFGKIYWYRWTGNNSNPESFLFVRLGGEFWDTLSFYSITGEHQGSCPIFILNRTFPIDSMIPKGYLIHHMSQLVGMSTMGTPDVTEAGGQTIATTTVGILSALTRELHLDLRYLCRYSGDLLRSDIIAQAAERQHPNGTLRCHPINALDTLQGRCLG